MGPGHRSRSPRTRSRRDQRRGGHLCQTPACCPSTSTPRRNPMASLGASALLVEEAHARPGGGGVAAVGRAGGGAVGGSAFAGAGGGFGRTKGAGDALGTAFTAWGTGSGSGGNGGDDSGSGGMTACRSFSRKAA